jgi:hypothetical protein
VPSFLPKQISQEVDVDPEMTHASPPLAQSGNPETRSQSPPAQPTSNKNDRGVSGAAAAAADLAGGGILGFLPGGSAQEMRGGDVGDFQDPDQVPDYMPVGHDWRNLKYCITKKVAADIQASIEKQSPEIKAMCKKVVYFHLHSHLTEYADPVVAPEIPAVEAVVDTPTDGTQNPNNMQDIIKNASAPPKKEVLGNNGGEPTLTSTEVPASQSEIPALKDEANPDDVKLEDLDDTLLPPPPTTPPPPPPKGGAPFTGGGKPVIDSLDDLVLKFTMTKLDEMCMNLPNSITEHILLNYWFDKKNIDQLKARIDGSSSMVCPIIKRPPYDQVPKDILGNWIPTILANPPPNELATKLNKVKKNIPNVFKPEKIDNNLFKQNLWFRGINKIDKTVGHLATKLFRHDLIEQLNKDAFAALDETEQQIAKDNMLKKPSNFKDGIIQSFMFYQSHPYMLKIVYDRLEPIFRSFSREYDEDLTRLFYYSSIKFTMTVSNALQNGRETIPTYIRQHILWENASIKKKIDAWKKLFTSNITKVEQPAEEENARFLEFGGGKNKYAETSSNNSNDNGNIEIFSQDKNEQLPNKKELEEQKRKGLEEKRTNWTLLALYCELQPKKEDLSNDNIISFLGVKADEEDKNSTPPLPAKSEEKIEAGQEKTVKQVRNSELYKTILKKLKITPKPATNNQEQPSQNSIVQTSATIATTQSQDPQLSGGGSTNKPKPKTRRRRHHLKETRFSRRSKASP